MLDENRDKIEDLINHFLEAADKGLPQDTLIQMLCEVDEALSKEDQHDEEVIREYGLVGVYFTGLDEKKGFEVMKKAFKLNNELGLVEFPHPFTDEKGNPYNTIVYTTMALYLSENKQYEEALEYFDIAYNKYDDEKDRMSVACYALDYASCLRAVDKRDEAEKMCHEGIQASYDAFGEYNPFALSLMKALSMLSKEKGDEEAVKKYEKMYQGIYDGLEAMEEEAHNHHHHCGCGCEDHHDEDCGCGEHHHHHDDDCDCGCHH